MFFHCNHFPVVIVVIDRCFIFGFKSRNWAIYLRQCGATAGPRAACAGPRKYSWKIFKSEICCKACELTFISLNFSRWIKCIRIRTMNNTFSVNHYWFCFIYLFYDQIIRCGPPPASTGAPVWTPSAFFGGTCLHWGTCPDTLCVVFGAPTFVMTSWRVHLAQ